MMSKIFYYLFIFFLFGACTNFIDDSKLEIESYKSITVESINTKLKVIDLEVDQEEFDNMYENYDDGIEIEGYFKLYKNNEILIENELVEIEIKGSVSAAFVLKSLGIKFDDTYKNKENNYNLIQPELLSNHSVDKIKSIRLRNSGNDFLETMIKDVSYTKLAINANLNLDLMYAEPVVVFVNNVFFGLMNLRTEKNANGISRLYNVKKKKITLAKVNHPGELEYKDGDFDKIDDFVDAINQEDYNYLINEIDEDNFIDYMIFESYIANHDWPKNNVVFFSIDDGPFRFFLFDLDACSTRDINKSPLFFINNEIENTITDLFNVLYANNNFKLKYDLRWDYLMNSDLLSTNKFEEIVNYYKNNIEQIIPMQIEKYGFPENITSWYLNLDELKFNFKKREGFVK